MTAQANHAPPGSAELNWLWRVALVGGLTLIVVLVWALRESDPAAAPVPESTQVAVALPAPATPAPQAATADPASPVASPTTPQPAAAPAPLKPPAQSGIIPGRPDPPTPTSPAAFERYIVQRGETLFLIAALRGVALDDLLLFNPELGDGSVLHAGAAIWIPVWEATDDDAP